MNKKTNNVRTKTIVVSDIHLGADDSFSETVKNRQIFIEFLKRIQSMPDVSELVIAGDFLDEWYVPMDYPPYESSEAFYAKSIENNREVFSELKKMQASGVDLVYVPGNHDMTLTADILESALPGIKQARDVNGLGTYYTGRNKNVAIEHGHRYDVFSSPDTVSNKMLPGSGDAILPPGYFYARYAASWVTEGRPDVAKSYPEIHKIPDRSDEDQFAAYAYYAVLHSEFTRMTPTEGFGDKTFHVDHAGLAGDYSVEDMYPVAQGDGTISSPVLFRNFQRNWAEIQANNEVKVNVDFAQSAAGATGYKFLESQAKKQYLENNDRNIDIVVFGHTHIPQYLKLENGKVYIDSGTWVDNNTSDANHVTRTFAVIDSSGRETAALYTYGEDGKIDNISESMIK